MRQTLLQNGTAILLQNATKVYYKMRQLFLSQNATVLLQKATVTTKHNNFIAKCDIYYKMHQHRLEHSFSPLKEQPFL